MELKKTAEPREQLLGLVMILAIFMMFFRVIYFPKREASEQLNTQISNLRLERDALHKFSQALAAKLKESGGKKDVPRQMAVKVQILKGETNPLTEQTSDLLAYLTSAPMLKGLVVREMSDLPSRREDGFEKAGFYINAEGTFGNITKYLDRVNTMPVLLTIDNITLKAVAPKAAKINVEVNGSLFSLGG